VQLPAILHDLKRISLSEQPLYLVGGAVRDDLLAATFNNCVFHFIDSPIFTSPVPRASGASSRGSWNSNNLAVHLSG
jgi:hypothetical protein